VLFFAPLVAYFVPMPWQALFGIIPTFWPAKLYWAFLSGEPALGYFFAGLLYPISSAACSTRRCWFGYWLSDSTGW
jgi:fluoroquinolone transport system permease protein